MTETTKTAKLRSITVKTHFAGELVFKQMAVPEGRCWEKTVYEAQVGAFTIRVVNTAVDYTWPWHATISDALGRATRGKFGLLLKGYVQIPREGACDSVANYDLKGYQMKIAAENAMRVCKHLNELLSTAPALTPHF
jgi:hypothetical protein